MTIGKFDYKKWIIENKYGIINEQTGSATGSASTGSASTGSASTGSASTGSLEPFVTSSGCDSFNTLASENQLLACQAYFNLANPQMDPNLTQWVDGGNCCEGIYTGSMAGGMPSPQGGSKPKPKPKPKRKEKDLREIKYILNKEIKKLR